MAVHNATAQGLVASSIMPRHISWSIKRCLSVCCIHRTVIILMPKCQENQEKCFKIFKTVWRTTE